MVPLLTGLSSPNANGNLTITLSNGTLNSDSTFSLNLNGSGKLTPVAMDPGISKFRLNLNLSTGLINGAYSTKPGIRIERHALRGVIFQKTGIADGFDLGPKESRNFNLTPKL